MTGTRHRHLDGTQASTRSSRTGARLASNLGDAPPLGSGSTSHPNRHLDGTAGRSSKFNKNQRNSTKPKFQPEAMTGTGTGSGSDGTRRPPA